jgi:hypothetical protein
MRIDDFPGDTKPRGCGNRRGAAIPTRGRCAGGDDAVSSAVIPAGGRAMTHAGSCHCGRIAFTLEGEVSEAIDCNCSMCRRRGSLLAFFPREALTLTSKEGDYGTYRFNTEKIAHHFCQTCGVSPFSEAIHPKTGVPTVAVNVRCLPDVDIAALDIKQVDGASF